jgi:hypothetical protein
MRGMQRIGGSKDANIITDVLHYNGLEETKTAGANNFPLYAPTTNIPQWPL